MIRKQTQACLCKLQKAFVENLFLRKEAAAEYEKADAQPGETEMTVTVCDLAAKRWR